MDKQGTDKAVCVQLRWDCQFQCTVGLWTLQSPRLFRAVTQDIIIMQQGLCPSMNPLVTAPHCAICGILTHMAAEPRHSAFGVAEQPGSRHQASTVYVHRKEEEAQEGKTNPPSHKECLVRLVECQLPDVKHVELSPESCFLSANVTITFLCLSLLWSKTISESLIPPRDAVMISETMLIKCCEESYSESYMMTRCIIKPMQSRPTDEFQSLATNHLKDLKKHS